MKAVDFNGCQYRLPGGLNAFQQQLYIHLIGWKWKHISKEPGYHRHRGEEVPYDAILPKDVVDQYPLIYRSVVDDLRRHHRVNPFRIHTHFNHMASSQAAAANLFLPVLQSARGNDILSVLKPDFASLAVDQLDRGYCLEYWGGNFDVDTAGRGPLNDKSSFSGTDADVAIAYRNHSGALCLWLIEHKLAETEFTTCGGFRSKNRSNFPSCDCTRTYSEILTDKNLCYHHLVRSQRYWEVVQANTMLFAATDCFQGCPFRDGVNQLWRNQLLGLAVEQDKASPFEHSFLSVVRHPANSSLNRTLCAYEKLVGRSPRFSVHTSLDVVRAAEKVGEHDLLEWARWYRTLYMMAE